MFYCMKCGKAIPDDYAFCPVCGEKRFQEPVQAAVTQAGSGKMDGRSRGFGIAAMAVGIEGFIVSVLVSVYALLAFMAAMLEDSGMVGTVFGAMSIWMAIISLISGIVALILSGKALRCQPSYKLARLGRTFGLIATILSGTGILIGLLAVGLS